MLDDADFAPPTALRSRSAVQDNTSVPEVTVTVAAMNTLVVTTVLTASLGRLPRNV